jgi:uncharacterized protein YndB with AHSA1/START domain
MKHWVTGLLLIACTARAELLDSSPQGFTVRHRIAVAVPAPNVWAALTDVARWWEPNHTYTNDARNLRLEPIVGGCFCEKLGLYGGIEHMRVLYAEPVKHLRLEGALGPLQELAVTGRMSWDITTDDTGSALTLTYTVGGYAARPLRELASLLDEVLGVQMQRLRRLLENGSPEATN